MDAVEFYKERASWRDAGQETMRMKRVVDAAGEIGPMVLDLGCRDGGLRRVLPDDHLCTYYGVDIVPEFGVRHSYITTDDISQRGIRQPLGCKNDGFFDTVFAIDVLEHLERPAFVLQEIHRVLKPDGKAIISIPNPYHVKEILMNVLGIADKQGHIFSWSRQVFRALVGMYGFDVIRESGTWWVYPIPARGLLARSIIYVLRKK